MVGNDERKVMRSIQASLPRPSMVVFASVALRVATCVGYDGGVAPAPVLASLRLSLADSTVEVGQVTQARTMGVDQYGATITTGPVIFASSQPEIAAIMPTTGRIPAIAPGTALITASVDGKSIQHPSERLPRDR
jgi:hypothetical protein